VVLTKKAAVFAAFCHILTEFNNSLEAKDPNNASQKMSYNKL
jgi:hypothetical protein